MNIFISGIGGAGLGPLAEIALDAGFSVIGSDINHSLQTNELENRGVKIIYEQSKESIARENRENPIDWFIYTSALTSDAPELQFVRENNIKHSKRDEFLLNFIQKKNLHLIAVAGTHGKTTTSAMMIWVFKQLNLPISYSVGANLSFGASGTFDTNSRFFIYEADEYDRNFLHFSPEISLIPSLDYDHADIYKTQNEYNDAFCQFISQSNLSILWQKTIRKLNLENSAENLIGLEGKISRNEINLSGEIMRENAKLVLETLRQMLDDFDEIKIREILANFPGASRRFEKLADNIYSDYAHHPAEIAATIEIARELSDNVVVIYQPHQNLRQTEIMNDGGYKTSFDKATKVFWVPTYLVRGDLTENAPPILTPENLISTLSETAQNFTSSSELDKNLWREIYNLSKSSLVLFMGAGTIDKWIRNKLTEISSD